MKVRKKPAPKKGNAVPDNKPMNTYKKAAKLAVKSRAAGKKGT